MSRRKETIGPIKVCGYIRVATEEQLYGGFLKAELDAMLCEFMQSEFKKSLMYRL